MPLTLILQLFLLPATVFSGTDDGKEGVAIIIGANIQNSPQSIQGHFRKRPYLYINDQKLQFIKSRLDTRPYTKFWFHIKNKADQYARGASPDVLTADMMDRRIGRYGQQLPYIAMAYLITGSSRYIDAARDLMNALSSREDWGTNDDTDAAHVLAGMSISYDWMYASFSQEERQTWKNKIVRHANIFYDLLANDKIWWADSYLQNHNYTNAMGLAVAAVALQGEVADTPKWLEVTESNFNAVLSLLSPDGASHEGVGYWGYGTKSLLLYYMAVEPVYGLDRVLNSPFFQNTARYRLYMSIPGYRENVNYGDSKRFEWHGPGFILRVLAGLFDDGHAQWLADRIEAARGRSARNGLEEPKYSWLDLIWYDEDVLPVSADDLPTYASFDNLGIFVSRSGWNDDSSWLFFKAGPPQGKLARTRGIHTGSHIHPDGGNILFYNNGGWVAIDEGSIYKKRTDNHNVLMFNGVGQLGDGKKWFKGKQALKGGADASIIFSTITPAYQYLVADLGNLYRKEANVVSWRRSLVSLKGGLVIVVDDVVLGAPGRIDSLFHLATKATEVNEKLVCVNSGKDVSDKNSSYGFLKLLNPDISFITESYQIPEDEWNKRFWESYTGTLAKATAVGVKNIRLIYILSAGECSEGNYERFSLVNNNKNMIKIVVDGGDTIIDLSKRQVTLH